MRRCSTSGCWPRRPMIALVLACSPAAWPGTLRRLQLSQSWLPCRRRRYAKICRMCPVVLRLADHRHRSQMVFLDAVDKADLPARPSSAILQPSQEHSPLQGNIRPPARCLSTRMARRCWRSSRPLPFTDPAPATQPLSHIARQHLILPPLNI